MQKQLLLHFLGLNLLFSMIYKQFSMSSQVANPAKCEIRAVIRFLQAKGNKPAEIYRQICDIYGPHAMSDGQVRQWCRLFREGRENIHDEVRCGPPTVITDRLVDEVNAKIRENRRLTISELSLQFPNVSRSVIYEIVTEKLGYKKLCARWVPKMLTDAHKQKRLASAENFLHRFETQGDELFEHIITGDETWISYTNVESKQQSMQWRHSASPKAKKFKQARSAKKIMATVFWDKKGILLIDFLEHGETINADKYCETLRKLRRAIQNKRRGLLSSGVVLLHDNARPHTAAATGQLLDRFRWDIFDHPPYSPDLAPSDYHLFMHLKKWLALQRFGNDDELKNGVTKWFKTQAGNFYEDGILKLLKRYQKCVDVDGDYVEK